MRKIKPKVDEYMEGSIRSMKPKKAEPRYPTIRIELDHIPEAKSWKLNKEYTVTMKLKMVGLSNSRFDKSAEFEIREIEAEGGDDKEGDEKDNENDDE